MNTQEKIGRQKLEEIKPQLALIATDYDETVRSRIHPTFSDNRAFKLIQTILLRYPLIIITARAATAIKTFLPYLNKNTLLTLKSRFFLGGGNGRMLYELIGKNFQEIYTNSLTAFEVKSILEVYDEVFTRLKIKKSELLQKGLTTYKLITSQLWNGIIPYEIFKQCLIYKYRVFTEKAKVGLIRVSNDTQNHIFISCLSATLNRKYPDKFQVIEGDIDIHIVKKMIEDGKVKAVKTVIHLMQIKSEQVATFGDLPNGNDRGLLTHFPFSFTNSVDFFKKKPNLTFPPFLLPGALNSPINSVHKAFNFLLR